MMSSSRSPGFEKNLYKTRVETQIPFCANRLHIQNLTESHGVLKESHIIVFEKDKFFLSPCHFFLISGKIQQNVINHKVDKEYSQRRSEHKHEETILSSYEEIISETDSIKLLSRVPKKSGFYQMGDISEFSSKRNNKRNWNKERKSNILSTSLDQKIYSDSLRVLEKGNHNQTFIKTCSQ
jgi:hypothetical protein